MFEIFPWNPQLETGIALIDEQHRVLVNLINRLAQQHVQGATQAEVQAILGELADYADYHFRTEEGIWHTALAGDVWLDKHMETHQRFFTHMVELQSGQRAFQEVLDDLFSYLIQWLAYHILDNDKRMALALNAIEQGLSVGAAHAQADAHMEGATATLIQTVLGMYQTLSSQALILMHEKLGRQRAEQALADSEARWHLLHTDAGQTPTTWTATERRLRTLLDAIPSGVVAVDTESSQIVFANPWFCQMLGYSQDELLNMRVPELHPPEALHLVQADFQQMSPGAAKAAMAIPVRRKNGSIFMAIIERVPLTLDGKPSVLGGFTDITERHRAEQALQTSELHLRILVDTIPDLIWLKDANGVYLSCNPAFEQFFGAPETDIVGKTDHDFVPKALADFFREKDLAAMAAQRPTVNEEWVTFASDGHRALLEATKVAMTGPNGELLGVLGISHDITERANAAAALDAERLRLQNAIDAAHAGTWEWDIAANVVRYNERAAVMLGYKAEGKREGPFGNVIAMLHPDDRQQEQLLMARHLSGELPRFEIEMRLRHQDGHWVWFRTLGRVTQRDTNHKPLYVAGICIDITEQKTHREQIDHITHHDALTGLPNRKMFVALLDVAMAACTAQHKHLAVAYIDLDGLADINNAHGLEVGSQVILEVSRRLSQTMREHPHIAHIGGDEFAVILGELDKAEAYLAPVKRLLAVVSAPVHIEGLDLSVTASIGITLYPQGDTVDAEQLLRQADQAMYRAKLAGKNRHHLFDPVSDGSTRDRFLRINEIRQGLLSGEFLLHFQPKVHLISGEVVGFEALIRWQHPTRGLLAPAQFIPTLDKHPMAITLGDWVIEAALGQLAQWNAQGLNTAVSVNIDSLQLHDPDFSDRLQRQLRAQPTVRPSQLELEILETGAMEDMAHVSALIGQLQSIGMECSLDDFGTGYSSLTFLKQLTAHTIKIDQSFVRGMLDDAEHATLVSSVLDLARNFDRRALAEGVETEAHGQLLIEFGCELGQGYAIARPMPGAAVPHWLLHWHVPQAWAQSQAVGLREIPVLLAEVEHRGWLKHLHAFAARHEPQVPAESPHDCRLGRWLAKPSTCQQYQSHPEFTVLCTLHERLHARARELVHRVEAHEPTSVATERLALDALDALSNRVLGSLRHLRQADANSPWPDTSSAPL
ncbi:MAG: bacteriohemerythrin [Rhodoferax sp.]|uniref:bacteriohemerythrin n=1 Tax=Rhodoferax sp. TaxID=50421 RepID=UPI0026058714|nr:bacteriohemerythrin [Rhodoferax sp.]MDD2882309.1 bacteriohemerythrin [Rhodoferax sp.]